MQNILHNCFSGAFSSHEAGFGEGKSMYGACSGQQLDGQHRLGCSGLQLLRCRSVADHYGHPDRKGAKSYFFRVFLYCFFGLFKTVWPLALPNIAKKGGPLQKLARGDRQTHFGTFNFWGNLDFSDFGSKLIHFLDFLTGDTLVHSPQTHFHTLQYRKSMSSRMPNRYTRIFDAG